MTYEEWVSEVEAAVGSEERLIELQTQLALEPGLSEYQHAEVAGRIDRYRDNHEDARGAVLVMQADAALAGKMRDDAVPDFDLDFEHFEPEVAEVEEAYVERLHPRDRRGRWRENLGLPRLALKRGPGEAKRPMAERHVVGKVREVAAALVDFYGGGGDPFEVYHEEEYLATVGSDARYRHSGQAAEGLLFGGRAMRDLRDPEMGVDWMRVIAHEAAHSLSGTRPGPLPGFSQTVEEGGAEVLSLWFWRHLGQPFDERDATRVEGKWTEGLDRLVHHVAYREEVAEVVKRAASKVGWDRGAIIDEVEEVFRGEHYDRLNWRDTTEEAEPPEGVGGDAVGLMGWLLADDVEEAYVERLHPRDRLGRWREMIGSLHTITKADVVAGKVPGFKYDPDISPGIAAHMYDREHMTLGPGAFRSMGDEVEHASSMLLAHEIGHRVGGQIIKRGDISKVPEVQAYRGEGESYSRGAGYGPKYENPFGASERPEEMLADAYSELLHSGLRGRWESLPDERVIAPGHDEPGTVERVYTDTYLHVDVRFPDGTVEKLERKTLLPADEPTEESEIKRVALLKLVAQAARELGLPDEQMYRLTKEGSERLR